MLMAGAALAAAALSAMPTADEIKEARPLVSELMVPEMKALQARTKTAAEVGDAACMLAKDAAGEGAKWLLLSGAVTYYARDGKCDRALETLKALRGMVKDIPDVEMRNLLATAVKAVPNGIDKKVLSEAGLEADGRVRAAEGLKKAQAALKQTPKDPSLHRRAGACLAVLDDWEEALKEFARADEKTMAAAKGEQRRSWAPEKIADFWWDEAVKARGAAKAAYLRHAASLYADAVGSGALVGLAKTRAERRIAEAEETCPTSGLFVSAADTALYLVVDLSAGSQAKHYPVSRLKDVPKGGWTDEYKTTKLVLRRLEPGSYIMGDDQKDESHRVTITKPFYMGVFEVTQRQWELVEGNRPSFFKNKKVYATRPVEKVRYTDIRGADEGLKWPDSTDVDANSFLGRLRARTKLAFDLPTEGQWEYACRAGATGYSHATGGLDAFCRHLGNCGRKKLGGPGWVGRLAVCESCYGTAAVGSFAPNAWGLYDMHGNVREKCIDAKGHPYGTDPTGTNRDGKHVVRGGGWLDDVHRCVSPAYRVDRPHAAVDSGDGFRLSCSAGPR